MRRMAQAMGSEPASRSVTGGRPDGSSAARRWAWVLGFALPLSGGFAPSRWVAGYPDQLTLIRLVTFASLVWLSVTPRSRPVPMPSRRMVHAFSAVLIYAAISLLWTPDQTHGIHDLATIAMALATGLAVLLLVRDDRRALASFVAGVALAFGLQVIVAVVEVRTGVHLSNQFGASYLDQWQLANVEVLFGSVAWGTLGNPNDLGGYFLLSIALLASSRAYGLVLARTPRLLMWAIVGGALAVGLTSLADARAFRVGMAIVVVLHVLDRVLPLRGNLRVPLMMLLSSAVAASALWVAGPVVAAINYAGRSDPVRLGLISRGLSDSLRSGGFGLGVGAEKSLIESGQIPLNFHSVVVQLAAELGLIVAGIFLAYLAGLFISWTLVTRSAREIGREAALARATLATSLLIYGFTSSGVLESPYYWAFFSLTVLLTSTRHSEALGTASPCPCVLSESVPPCCGPSRCDPVAPGAQSSTPAPSIREMPPSAQARKSARSWRAPRTAPVAQRTHETHAKGSVGMYGFTAARTPMATIKPECDFGQDRSQAISDPPLR